MTKPLAQVLEVFHAMEARLRSHDIVNIGTEGLEMEGGKKGENETYNACMHSCT